MGLKMLSLHLDRVSDITFEASEEIEISNNSLEFKGEFKCKDLTFSYSDSKHNIFTDLSFKIKQGETVALIGKSGCGKSTLLNVLLRIHQPKSGVFDIDDTDVHTLGLPTYRANIAAVGQDDSLISGTILESIVFFSETPYVERIEQCAKIASIYDEIMSFPMRFNTLIDNMGSALSGGQKQRLLIARAIYQNPKILFLDKATNHIEPKTQKRVNEHVVKNLKSQK